MSKITVYRVFTDPEYADAGEGWDWVYITVNGGSASCMGDHDFTDDYVEGMCRGFLDLGIEVTETTFVGSQKDFESKHTGYEQTHTILGQEAERAKVLLKAARDLLRTCDDGPFVKNALEETVFYDGTDCDGTCLMEEIEELLESLGDEGSVG